ncbi:FAD-binding oxidoreductase [Mesonia sp.]|uniref:NAD(P)/FAD-dependent oxidoreductase n=1 Tax=Mesonia sp. TaxID=1960830 RepID=UPI001765C2EA|nr:FAD-binding oxidoreductase [Mesonia sp.]HIB38419.1 FAD-binding oxidoreductase [Mesonia sp.]
MKKVDYIIVGFGLSGLHFAKKLIDENKSFVVFDDNSENASLVAGGIFNPVILKRFNLAWNADLLLTHAKEVYESLERLLGVKFLHSKPIYRRFNSVEEQNDWFSASDQSQLSKFLNTDLKKSIPYIQSEFSFGEVNKTGYLDTVLLIKSFKNYLQQQGNFIEEAFNYNELNSAKNSYKDFTFNKIVFCEGNGLSLNPFFNDLPLVGNKGEYVTIKCEGLNLEEMLKFSLFLIPLGNDLYKVGATYNRQFKDREPSTSAKKQILIKLDKVLELPYEVVHQEAGIRPTTKDRRALIGRHSEIKNFYVNNGYGSRGILLAPSAAKWLFNFIEYQQELPKEIDIARFN